MKSITAILLAAVLLMGAWLISDDELFGEGVNDVSDDGDAELPPAVEGTTPKIIEARLWGA